MTSVKIAWSRVLYFAQVLLKEDFQIQYLKIKHSENIMVKYIAPSNDLLTKYK